MSQFLESLMHTTILFLVILDIQFMNSFSHSVHLKLFFSNNRSKIEKAKDKNYWFLLILNWVSTF